MPAFKLEGGTFTAVMISSSLMHLGGFDSFITLWALRWLFFIFFCPRQKRKHHHLLFFPSATIIATVSTGLHWLWSRMTTLVASSTSSNNWAYSEDIPGSRCGPEDGPWPRPYAVLQEEEIWRELRFLARPQSTQLNADKGWRVCLRIIQLSSLHTDFLLRQTRSIFNHLQRRGPRTDTLSSNSTSMGFGH